MQEPEKPLDDEQLTDDYFKALQKERNRKITQRRVSNILNLEIAQFDGVGMYDIPQMEPVYELEPIKEWIGFNYVLSDTSPEGKAVHFFVDDYQFQRIWNDPDKYVEKLKKYVCVVAPDFSLYGDMPLATQIYNLYRKQWIACYLQHKGVTVIPCVRASTDPRSFDFYCDGMPEGGIVMISNMWTKKPAQREYFVEEFETMKDLLKPCKIFVYGRPMEELSGNIEYVKTFTDRRFRNGKRV